MPQHSHTTQLKLTILISCSLLGALAGCGQEARKKPKPKKAPQAQPKEQGPPKVDGKTEDEWAREINSDDPKTLKRAMNALVKLKAKDCTRVIYTRYRDIGHERGQDLLAALERFGEDAKDVIPWVLKDIDARQGKDCKALFYLLKSLDPQLKASHSLFVRYLATEQKPIVKDVIQRAKVDPQPFAKDLLVSSKPEANKAGVELLMTTQDHSKIENLSQLLIILLPKPEFKNEHRAVMTIVLKQPKEELQKCCDPLLRMVEASWNKTTPASRRLTKEMMRFCQDCFTKMGAPVIPALVDFILKNPVQSAWLTDILMNMGPIQSQKDALNKLKSSDNVFVRLIPLHTGPSLFPESLDEHVDTILKMDEKALNHFSSSAFLERLYRSKAHKQNLAPLKKTVMVFLEKGPAKIAGGAAKHLMYYHRVMKLTKAEAEPMIAALKQCQSQHPKSLFEYKYFAGALSKLEKIR